jgi:adenosylhomocysteine nucleosidase
MAFWEGVESRRRVASAPCRAWFCQSRLGGFLVLETGLGRGAMESAVQWALDDPTLDGQPYRPTLLLLAGFSGALDDSLEAGDLLLATAIVAEGEMSWRATWPETRTAAFRQGKLLTVDRLVADPADKRELNQLHGALAVDMESATVARICQRGGVPFGCLRAISDRVDTMLSPALLGLLRSGRPSAVAVAAVCLRQPGIIVELWRLARDTRLAARQLADGVGRLLKSAPAFPLEGTDQLTPA